MKTFKAIALLFVALLASSCGEKFREHEALFDVYNRSNHPTVLLINGTEQVRVEANGYVFVEVKILVPAKPVGSPTTVYSVDRWVQVSTAFKNLVTGALSPSQICQSGAKVITTIEYRADVYGNGPGYVSCYPKY